MPLCPIAQQALRINPLYAEAHKNQAIVSLLRGDFVRGWPEYEWRWKCPGSGLPAISQPRWTGESLATGLGINSFIVTLAMFSIIQAAAPSIWALLYALANSNILKRIRRFGIVEVVRQLQGVAVPASVLERDVLPARIPGYQPRLLDEPVRVHVAPAVGEHCVATHSHDELGTGITHQ